MKFKAIIFDFDGTLVDTLKDIADTMNQILQENGFPQIPVENYRKLIGSGVEQLVMKSIPEKHQNDQELIHRLIDDYRMLYEQNWERSSKLYFGIRDLLDKLELKEVPRAIISNKDEQFLKKAVQKILFKWEFKMVAGIGGAFPPKPNPEAIIYFIRNRGIKPENCALLGDSGLDMQTALNAGCFPIGALWGYRDEQELKENGARLLIKYPHQLLELF